MDTESWKSQKALLLLKTLLANQGKSVSREWLLEHFWPNQPHERSLRTFNTTVYYLRQFLRPYSPDEKLIHHKNGRYRFHSEQGCWYDVEEFESVYRQALACEQHDGVLALRRFTQAIELYRGDYFAEEEYVEWAATSRAHYLEIYIQALLKAVALLRKFGNLEEAIRLCEVVLHKDPLRGDAHEYLIHLLFSAGRVSEAANHYRKYSKVLSEELGLNPTLTLDQMLQGIGLGIRQAAATRLPRGRDRSRLNLCNRSMFDAIVHARSDYQRLIGETPTILKLHFARELNDLTKDELLSILGANLRSDDVVCYASDRLVLILLSRTSERAADFVKERLRSALNSQRTPLKAIDIRSPDAYSSS